MTDLAPDFFGKLAESDSYLEQLHERVWLMDNHKRAYWVWELHRQGLSSPLRYGLLHFDHHFDGINDFHDDPEMLASLENASLTTIKKWLDDDDHGYIRYDSFIAPAIIRGLVNDIHFFCPQWADETDPGMDADFLETYGVRQTLHESIESAAQADVTKPYIFDLCLDLFNRDPSMWYKGDPWPLLEIETALNSWRHLIVGADVITISLSFGCSGTEEQTRYLAEMVVPIILNFVRG